MQRVRADSTRYAGLQHIGSDPVKSVAALQRPVAVTVPRRWPQLSRPQRDSRRASLIALVEIQVVSPKMTKASGT
jgi:hypothetical protein